MNPEFYEDEVIEGFYVPAMLKMAWGAQMDVLKETDAICRRHDIPYFADWGTLLATIRHSGYIPWDDDLDISMRRRDYERFLKYAETELPDGFKVMHFKNHPGHHFFVARIVGKPRICFEEDHLTRFHGFPYIAGLDLFVMDNVCRDRNIEKLKAKKAEFVITVADNIADGATTGDEAAALIRQCEEYTGVKIDPSLSGEDLRVFLYSIAEALFASIPDEESDALIQMMPFGMYGNERYIPKEYFRKTVRLPYMDTTMPVPLCFDTVMRFKFGNYMQIHKAAGGHDYPFYYGQHQDLISVLDFEYPAYKATYEDIIGTVSCTGNSCEAHEDIVFMPFAAKYWKYMEKLYRHYADDNRYTVHVVPIPYYYKTWDGMLKDEVFDIDAYPSDITVEKYKDIDLGTMHPAKIVIQNPFDEWNPVYSVPPKFYSCTLKQYTDELVYIPFFVTNDFTKADGRDYINMDHYVCMPGVINADTVILPSDTLKNTYTEKITEFIKSEDEQVLNALDRKIAVCPEYVYDPNDETFLPEDNNGKKTIIYLNTISVLAEYGQKAVDKIRRIIDVFEESRDKIKVIWISVCCGEELDLIDENVANGYKRAVEDYKKSGLGDFIRDLPASENIRYAKMYDAYYGDPSSLALRFFYENKPVMIENIEV